MVAIWDWTAAAVRDTKLSAGAFRTGVALAQFADSRSGEGAHPGQTKLAEILGITDRGVRKNLDALESAGWIIKVSRGGRAGHQNRASVYNLSIPPGTAVPTGTDMPIGTTVPHPTGTLELPNRNFQDSQPEPPVPTILSYPSSPKASSPRPRSRGSALPDGFSVSEKLRTWAAVKAPGIDLARETDKFRAHHMAKGSLFKDWDAAWQNWMLKASDFQRTTLQPQRVMEFD